jgi:hypothetical protein
LTSRVDPEHTRKVLYAIRKDGESINGRQTMAGLL